MRMSRPVQRSLSPYRDRYRLDSRPSDVEMGVKPSPDALTVSDKVRGSWFKVHGSRFKVQDRFHRDANRPATEGCWGSVGSKT